MTVHESHQTTRGHLRLLTVVAAAAITTGCASSSLCPLSACYFLPDSAPSSPWDRPPVKVNRNLTARQLYDLRAIDRMPDGEGMPDRTDTKSQNPPSLCLALSGGGVRSAAFSVGILASLQKSNVLNGVEEISSVSGGSYAASWYFTQLYRAAKADAKSGSGSKELPLSVEQRLSIEEEMFKRPSVNGVGIYQHHLEKHSRMMTEQGVVALSLATIGWSIPANIVANAVFSQRVNVGIARIAHERSVRVGFQTTPRIEPIDAPDDDISLYELGSFSAASGLPRWYINATVWPKDDDPHNLALASTVYSFGPTDYGSESFGRWRYSDDVALSGDSASRTVPPIGVAEAVVNSAAAIDSNRWAYGRPFARTFLSGIGVSLGDYTPNPAFSIQRRFIHRILPIPFYYGYYHNPDMFGTHLYLSDGAHADNLGVFTLIQHACKSIIIVDAEEDPNYQYESYFLLKSHLLQRDYLDPELDIQIDAIWKPLCDRAKAKFRALTPRQIHERAKAGQLINELETYNSEACHMSSANESKSYPNLIHVMEGDLATQTPNRTAKLYYLKLGYKPEPDLTEMTMYVRRHYRGALQEVFSGEPCDNPLGLGSVDAYYYCQWEKCDLARENPLYAPLRACALFPQQPTLDQNFSQIQFRAYVDLGRLFGDALKEVLPSVMRPDDTNTSIQR